MELKYPINLVNIDQGATAGDVVTRDGEVLGAWSLANDVGGEGAILAFVSDGQSEPIFLERIHFRDSGMHTGLAMSQLCASIRDWHDDQDQIENRRSAIDR